MAHDFDAEQHSALRCWMNTLVRFVRSDQPDLTNRQMAILMTVYMQDGPHTVRGLAARLGVSKPVVTRALNTLGAYGYLRRRKDESDLRNVLIEQTPQGADFLSEFSDQIDDAFGTVEERPAMIGTRSLPLA